MPDLGQLWHDQHKGSIHTGWLVGWLVYYFPRGVSFAANQRTAGVNKRKV